MSQLPFRFFLLYLTNSYLTNIISDPVLETLALFQISSNNRVWTFYAIGFDNRV